MTMFLIVIQKLPKIVFALLEFQLIIALFSILSTYFFSPLQECTLYFLILNSANYQSSKILLAFSCIMKTKVTINRYYVNLNFFQFVCCSESDLQHCNLLVHHLHFSKFSLLFQIALNFNIFTYLFIVILIIILQQLVL